jgi:hypothetical protein
MRAREFLNELRKKKAKEPRAGKDQLVDESWINPEIEEILTKKGYKLLGQGQDQMAFLEPGTGQVLKIFGTESGQKGFSPSQQMFFVWFKYCQKNNTNPFLPRFSGFETFEFQGQTYIQMRQERLYRTNRDLTDSVVQWGDWAIDFEDFDEFMQGPDPRDIKKIGKKNMFILWKTLREILHVCEQNGYDFDLDGNVMNRANGTPVIVDPWIMPHEPF